VPGKFPSLQDTRWFCAKGQRVTDSKKYSSRSRVSHVFILLFLPIFCFDLFSSFYCTYFSRASWKKRQWRPPGHQTCAGRQKAKEAAESGGKCDGVRLRVPQVESGVAAPGKIARRGAVRSKRDILYASTGHQQHG
jgi:hypothetical protein